MSAMEQPDAEDRAAAEFLDANGIPWFGTPLRRDLASRLREARRLGLEEAAAKADEHRQELFEDGLEADLHDFGDDVKSAFLAGCQQERECIVDAIRSLTGESNGR